MSSILQNLIKRRISGNSRLDVISAGSSSNSLKSEAPTRETDAAGPQLPEIVPLPPLQFDPRVNCFVHIMTDRPSHEIPNNQRFEEVRSLSLIEPESKPETESEPKTPPKIEPEPETRPLTEVKKRKRSSEDVLQPRRSQRVRRSSSSSILATSNQNPQKDESNSNDNKEIENISKMKRKKKTFLKRSRAILNFDRYVPSKVKSLLESNNQPEQDNQREGPSKKLRKLSTSQNGHKTPRRRSLRLSSKTSLVENPK